MPRKIRYTIPFAAIFHDLDGSLTGLGAGSWATFFYPHHNVSECRTDNATLEMYNGVVCDNTAQIRRIAFHEGKPSAELSGMSMYILRYDESETSSAAPYGYAGGLTEYTAARAEHSEMKFRTDLDPVRSWAVPFVTGHRYKIHWVRTGVDVTQMQLSLSERWQEQDKSIYLVHNFTDKRAEIKVTVGGVQVDNDTLPASAKTDLASTNAELQNG